jgi:hypothetical protein
VIGYLFWTISDNWEWADGYGPKFGLVAVDRANRLARIPRPSYHLFSKVRDFVFVLFPWSCFSPLIAIFCRILSGYSDFRW